MQLTKELQQEIIKTFDNLLQKKLENLGTHSDNCREYTSRELDLASIYVIEELEGNFEEYNNSKWVDPESTNYEQGKELILDFVRTL